MMISLKGITMETNNSEDNQNKTNSANGDHYKRLLAEMKIVNHRSDLLKFHRDTDNLDFDGR